MESLSVLHSSPLLAPLLHKPTRPLHLRPSSSSPLSPPPPPATRHRRRCIHAASALKSPRGFGPPSQKSKRSKRSKKGEDDDEEGEDDDEEGEDDDEEDDRIDEDDRDATIPEVVTNRMMRRMGLSIGIPLFVGLLFFPFFYYLKVVAKVDVPSWVPVLVSFFFFGTALLGVSYGIVSASWDPMREGSLLGWNEARRNWPVFWQSLWGGKK